MKKQNNFIKRYQADFDQAFIVPQMLDDIKRELTFTPRIIFTWKAKFRLAIELIFSLLALYGVKITYSTNASFGLNETSGQSEQFWILVVMSVLFATCFIIDFSYKLIKLYRLRIKKMAK